MNSLLTLPEDKEKLKGILSRDEYTAYTGAGQNPLWAWLLRLYRKLKSYFPDLHLPGQTINWLTIILLFVLMAGIAWAIYWFSKQIIRQRRIAAKPYLSPGELSRSYLYYWLQAQELGEAGLWREGVRSVFLTLLFFLEEQELIRVQKWKTNWEYAQEIAEADPVWVQLFHESSIRFEQIWYGKEEVSEPVYRAMVASVAQVLDKEVSAHHAYHK
jgi:hypothetical protein